MVSESFVNLNRQLSSVPDQTHPYLLITGNGAGIAFACIVIGLWVWMIVSTVRRNSDRLGLIICIALFTGPIGTVILFLFMG